MRPIPVVLGTLAALVSLVAAVLLFRAFGASTEVGFGARGYVVQSDRSVQVEFEVVKDPARTAVCSVRARDRTGVEVGNSLVRVGPSDRRRSIVRYELATSGRAASGELTSCELEAAPAG
ncbi:MAG TPA: DUF4307 domain-containing protein [Mycobacteriales bacterium]|nr:DUF4307 domain-containing protein [Mycobacteriales bacterium]